jgi:hypothetical protein
MCVGPKHISSVPFPNQESPRPIIPFRVLGPVNRWLIVGSRDLRRPVWWVSRAIYPTMNTAQTTITDGYFAVDSQLWLYRRKG